MTPTWPVPNRAPTSICPSEAENVIDRMLGSGLSHPSWNCPGIGDGDAGSEAEVLGACGVGLAATPELPAHPVPKTATPSAKSATTAPTSLCSIQPARISSQDRSGP